ncbi:MAG: bifunctional methylenetetrahydrofolate dehydrogenase/methenyltetrahydrofolate cyclohydrolase FolD [Betaproteobacteria bacterium]|nr:bifunctional methylenetetrahydrofolate dehydrogenase/methenyltetrahydrofolate cyclohydrolase FolD [Betaproteobacteria bacterium]
MTAIRLDGAAVARGIYSQLKARVAALGRRNVRPGLAALRVGDDPASTIYLRNKVRACNEVGIRSEVHALAADCPPERLLAMLDKFNRDPGVHGILVQLPLPKHWDPALAAGAVAPEKDVDGFTWRSLGALLAGHPLFEPCTPAGVVSLLEHAGVAIDGREAVVVGRSAIVGKPMALLLMARGATVTVCHSRTPDLEGHTRRADILVVAAGRPKLVSAGMVKPGAAVVDVGIHRLPDGKLAGDVDFAAVQEVAGWITPVPGGVGPMTVAMLIANTVQAAERQADSR